MDQFLEQWNALPAAVKFLLVVMVWVFMAGVYYFLVYEDQVKHYGNLVRTFKEVRKKRDKLQTIQFNIERWKSETLRLEGELEKARLLLPTEKQFYKLLRRIDDLARRARLQIIRFNPRSARKRGFYSEVPIQVEVNGSFYEIMGFLNQVNNLQRIVTLSKLSISQPRFKNQKMMLNARFQLSTYQYHGRKKKKRRRR